MSKHLSRANSCPARRAGLTELRRNWRVDKRAATGHHTATHRSGLLTADFRRVQPIAAILICSRGWSTSCKKDLHTFRDALSHEAQTMAFQPEQISREAVGCAATPLHRSAAKPAAAAPSVMAAAPPRVRAEGSCCAVCSRTYAHTFLQTAEILSAHGC